VGGGGEKSLLAQRRWKHAGASGDPGWIPIAREEEGKGGGDLNHMEEKSGAQRRLSP
jgi:hypothetical protein